MGGHPNPTGTRERSGGAAPWRGGLLGSAGRTWAPDRRRGLAAVLGFGLAFAGPLSAQDVELWGRIHGTTPPPGYYELMARDPGAFQFSRALLRRGLALPEPPPIQAQGGGLPAALSPVLALELAGVPERAPVAGTFRFPTVLGLFADSPEPAPAYSRERVHAEYWTGPQANPAAVGTIPQYYAEISRGLVTLFGTTFDWRRTPLFRSQVTAGQSGLGTNSRVGEFIVRVLQQLDDGSVDWGQFDNDGPDGVPNSGDDDGYVDALVVFHPTPGGECSSDERPNRIWSHRWNLYSAASQGSAWDPAVRTAIVAGRGYVTRTPAVPSSANGGYPSIRILDYTIQGVTNCAGTTLNDIGVVAHELGHAFGLPDLYNTDNNQSHSGIGNWGLMGTGSWGCNGASPAMPCHMEAWSKAVLGWVDVETLPPGMDLGVLNLPPVESTGKVFRLDSGDGSGEYLLLENRQRLGFDARLYAPGLLVWHIDPVTLSARWRQNRVNADPNRMGVWLRQADGLDELGVGARGRGDAGDPFPGSTGNRAFHAGSNPASWTHGGKAMGITLLDIAQVGSDMRFRALSRYQTLTLRSEPVQGTPGLVSVDGVALQPLQAVVFSAPFQTHTLEAAPGEPMGPGRRWGFLGWSDGAPRVRQFTTGLRDTLLVARYGGRQVRIAVSLSSPAQGIPPGSVTFNPGDAEGWVSEGETTAVTAVARTGFAFSRWTGDLAGKPNPAVVQANAPMTAEAVFDLTFSVAANPERVEVQGGLPNLVRLKAENANEPVAWTLVSGSLPSGLIFLSAGTLEGTPREGGEYPLTLRARDAIGLEGTVSLRLAVVDPRIPARTAATPFLLSGDPLDTPVQAYLDRTGNRNGVYDLGDLRAFLLRNPNLPVAASPPVPVEVRFAPLGSKPAPGGEPKKEEAPGEGGER